MSTLLNFIPEAVLWDPAGIKSHILPLLPVWILLLGAPVHLAGVDEKAKNHSVVIIMVEGIPNGLVKKKLVTNFNKDWSNILPWQTVLNSRCQDQAYPFLKA